MKKENLIKLVLIGIVIIIIAGLLMDYSIEASLNASNNSGELFPLGTVKQLISTGIAVILFFICANFPIKKFKSLIPISYFIYLFLLILVGIPGIGISVNGSYRWLGTGIVSVQPSQAALIVIPLLAAKLFSGRYLEDTRGDKKHYYYTFIILSMLAAGLVAIEPDMGTAAVIGISVLLTLYIVNIPFWLFSLFGLGSGGAALAAIFLKDSWKRRIFSHVNPLSDPKGDSYQLVNSMFAFARGGIFGQGYMRSIQKFMHFPASGNDFIFSIFAEEGGLILTTLILGIYLMIAICCLVWSFKAEDNFEKIYVGSLSIFVFIQTFINIGVVTGLLPTTGVPLPFFSQGGNHIVFELMAFGIAISLSRHKKFNN